MTRTALAMGMTLLAALLGGCGGDDGEPADPTPPAEAPPVAAPAPTAAAIAARVRITTSGTFAIAMKRVELTPAGIECAWVGTAALADDRLHAFECGPVERQAGGRDPLDGMGVTVENVVPPDHGVAPYDEFTISAVEIELLRSTVDGEERIALQSCALAERLGKPSSGPALPNLVRLHLDGNACAVVGRERYLNTVWLKVGGAPGADYHKYLYAGQAPGARPFIGGFDAEPFVELDFVTPAVPTADAMIVVALANQPTAAQYDTWVLTALSVRTGAGVQDLDLSLAIGCTGGPADASEVLCTTDGGTLTCAARNRCYQ